MNDLITLEYYKQVKQLKKADDDNKLGLIISGVSQLVKTYCGNTFNDYVDTALVESFSLDIGMPYIMLGESPLISVSSIDERTDVTSDYSSLETSDYEIDTSSDLIYRVGQDWPSGINAVKVTYTAGYSEIPYDLKLAVVDMVHYYHKDEYKQMRTLGAASIQNVVASAVENLPGFPDHIRRVLDMHRQLD